MGYFAGKVGEADYVFDKESIESFVKDFNEALIDKDITQDELDDLMSEIEQLEECGNIKQTLHSCELILEYFQYQPDLVTGVSPRFEAFWNKIWEPFTKQLLT